MPAIIVTQSFKACIGRAIHPTQFDPDPTGKPVEVPADLAELAIGEGWARPADPPPPSAADRTSGSQSRASGRGQSSSSPRQGRASSPKTSTRSAAKRA